MKLNRLAFCSKQPTTNGFCAPVTYFVTQSLGCLCKKKKLVTYTAIKKNSQLFSLLVSFLRKYNL